MFSSPLGVFDSNVDELMAIKHAFVLFKNSRKCVGSGLIIESDSRNATYWCVNETIRPWKLSSIFANIDFAIIFIGSVIFVNVCREANGMTDALAKACVHRPDFFSAWCFDCFDADLLCFLL
ncbi:hypothetical protein REPUB_Repub08aG0077300 [Reevesia pubescens]